MDEIAHKIANTLIRNAAMVIEQSGLKVQVDLAAHHLHADVAKHGAQICCATAVEIAPGEAPVTAATLPVQEFSPHGRARQSMALLSAAGIERLCSGVTNRIASGSATSDLNRTTPSGISQRMLTLTLRALERDGMVTRTLFPTIPPRVDYALTDLGRSLLEPVSELGLWARKHRSAIVDARRRFDAANKAE